MEELDLDLLETDRSLVVKCRIFVPCRKAKELFESYYEHSVQEIRDEFFDNLSSNVGIRIAKLGSKGKFCRKRSFKNGESEWVRQESIANNSNGHMYLETKSNEAEILKEDLNCFLSYDFKRIVLLHDKNNETVYSIVLDSVNFGNLNYSVLCFSCCFQKIVEWADIVDIARRWIFQQVGVRQLRPLPVYTKFMYVLRLSREFALFHDVYEELCSSDVGVCSQVEKLLKQRSLVDKEYIWINDQVPDIFESCQDMGWDVEKSIQYLSERQNRMLNDDSVFFLPRDWF